MSVPEQPITTTPTTTSPAPSAALRACEGVPASWDEARDSAFFRMTAPLFAPATTLAMTVLLASYDADPGSTDAG